MVELVVVVMIISLIAGFSVPNFTKALARAKARDAINNLVVIHASQSLYNATNGGYYSGASLDLLNTNLAIKLIANSATYECGTAAGVCTAALTGNTIRTSLAFSINRSAASLLCPNGGADAPTAASANPCCSSAALCP